MIDDERTFEKEYIEAMRQHAIEFAKWIIKNRWQVSYQFEGKWTNLFYDDTVPYLTTEQLYDKFNSDHQQVERSCSTCEYENLYYVNSYYVKEPCKSCDQSCYSNWKPLNE